MRPSDLDRERWLLIDRVLAEALEKPPSERSAYLDSACGDDGDLRTAVDELLEAHRLADGRLSDAGLRRAALAASAEEEVEGRTVGPFRIVREIGRGGMGVVYLARDMRLDRRVALKVLPPYLGVGPAARKRFLAEARAVSALDHANVATLHEIGASDDGQLYMAFAHYEGETLAETIERGPLDWRTAVSIAAEIAKGLAAAHERGVIHRDVKPSNILLVQRGGVRLLDFGVAKVAGGTLTGDGGPLGTVAYMSPEQAKGEELDQRTDLWSLGIVLYEMLTGERPFSAVDPAATLREIVDDDPRAPSRLGHAVPEGVERVLARLLRKLPADRYGDAPEVVEELSVLEQGHDVRERHSAAPTGNGRRSDSRASALRWLAYAAVAATLAWLGVARVSSTPIRAARAIERIAVLPLENLAGDPGRRYVVDGIHQALVAELSATGVFDVVSRTSVGAADADPPRLTDIVGRSDVDAVVEGSVLSDGDSVHVRVELIAVSPERRIWSGTYHGDLGGAPALTGRIARDLVATTSLAGNDSASAAPERWVEPRAYDAYLQARFNASRASAEALALAERYLEQAISMDSSFALAYAELAEVRGRTAFFGVRDPSDVLPGADALIETAIRLDSTVAIAYARRASVRLFWERDWEGAEQAARRALELNPSLVEGHFTLSEVMAVRGDYGSALAHAERGSELAPWDAFPAVRPALVHYYMRDFDQAVDRIREVIDFFPDFWQGHWIRCMSLAGLGRGEDAVRSCSEAVDRSRRGSMALAGLAYAHALNGDTGRARTLLSELEEPPEGTYVSPALVGAVYAGLGDRDSAFEWLERAYEERDLSLVHLRDQPFYDALHSDPRFGGLVRRLGLPPIQ